MPKQNFTEVLGCLKYKEKGFALTPSKYIEFIDHDLEIDYEKEMSRIKGEMKELLNLQKQSMAKLANAFKGIGFDIE